MKRILLFALALLCLVAAPKVQAQNIQFHYDLGRYLYPEVQAGRPYTTLTFEQQSVDKYGDTFYFVDMNFQAQGAVAANWKILRNLKFWKGPISWHLRYDGGMRFTNTGVNDPKPRPAISIKDAFFTGVTYTYLRPDRKLMISLTPSYKYIKGHHKPHNWEGVVVWKYAPGNGLFSATGFLTFWQEEHSWINPATRQVADVTNYKLMSQPQFWLNLNKLKGISKDFNLSVGTEVRISNNVDTNKFLVVPTLALKWSFGK